MDIHLWKRAQQLGIKEITYRTSETRMIRLIQQREGREKCYATEYNQVCGRQCEWVDRCCGLRARWLG